MASEPRSFAWPTDRLRWDQFEDGTLDNFWALAIDHTNTVAVRTVTNRAFSGNYSCNFTATPANSWRTVMLRDSLFAVNSDTPTVEDSEPNTTAHNFHLGQPLYLRQYCYLEPSLSGNEGEFFSLMAWNKGSDPWDSLRVRKVSGDWHFQSSLFGITSSQTVPLGEWFCAEGEFVAGSTNLIQVSGSYVDATSVLTLTGAVNTGINGSYRFAGENSYTSGGIQFKVPKFTNSFGFWLYLSDGDRCWLLSSSTAPLNFASLPWGAAGGFAYRYAQGSATNASMAISCLTSLVEPLPDAHCVWRVNGSTVLSNGQMSAFAPSGVSVGLCDVSPNVNVSLYVDDVRIAHQPIGPVASPAADLYCVDLRSRIGVSPLLVLTGWTPTDQVIWSLSRTGTTFLLKTNPAAGTIRQPISLRGLAPGQWTLRATLQNAAGTTVASDAVTWQKSYAGDPPVSADEWNNFCVANRPQFYVMDWLENYSYDDPTWGGGNWASNGIINLRLGGEGGVDANVSNNYKMMQQFWTNTGVRSVAGLPMPQHYSATGRLLPADTNDVAQWVTALSQSNHPSLFMFFWEDEPDMSPTCPSTRARQYHDITKAIDARWMTYINFTADAASFTGQTLSGGFFNMEYAQALVSRAQRTAVNRKFFYPYQVCDVYSVDSYPYYFTNYASVDSFALGTIQTGAWNYNMTPRVVTMQPYALTFKPAEPYYSGQVPTTNEINNMFWTAVACDAAAISYFEYVGWCSDPARGVYPTNWPAYYRNMRYMSQNAFALNDAITAPRLSGWTCDRAYDYLNLKGYTGAAETNGIFFKVTRAKGTNWIFAANVRRYPISASFSSGLIQAGDPVRSYFDKRVIAAAQGQFTDTLPALGYAVYYHQSADGDLPPTPDIRTATVVSPPRPPNLHRVAARWKSPPRHKVGEELMLGASSGFYPWIPISANIAGWDQQVRFAIHLSPPQYCRRRL